MRVLVNLLVLLGLPLFLIQSSTTEESTTSAPAISTFAGNTAAFCTPRFSFCLDYPHTLLSNKVESDNGDGIDLYNEDASIQVSAYGSNNIYGWDALEIIDYNLQEYASDGAKIKIQSIDEGLNRASVTFTYNGYLHYQEIQLMNNYYLVLNLSLEDENEVSMELLKSAVSLQVSA
jgi:hypothetical protein